MGFTPLQSTAVQAPRPGFTPIAQLDAEPDQMDGFFRPALETVKDIGRVYPVLETAANLATQMVALPVAGIAGLGTLATNALGVTEAEPADVVHNVAGALTYQPVTKSGQHLTGAVMYPFEKLQEAGQYAGGKTLDATDSPALATAADTAVQSLPMLLGAKGKGRGEVRAETQEVRSGFTPLEEMRPSAHQEARQGVVDGLHETAYAGEVAIDSGASLGGANIPLQAAPIVPVASGPLSRASEKHVRAEPVVVEAEAPHPVAADIPKVMEAEVRQGFTPLEEMRATVTQEPRHGVSMDSDVSVPAMAAENVPTARISPEIATVWEQSRDGITTQGGNPNAVLQVGDILHRAGAIKDAAEFTRVAEDIKATQALGLPEEASQAAINGIVQKHLDAAKNGEIDQGAVGHDLSGVAEQFPALPGGRGVEAEPLTAARLDKENASSNATSIQEAVLGDGIRGGEIVDHRAPEISQGFTPIDAQRTNPELAADVTRNVEVSGPNNTHAHARTSQADVTAERAASMEMPDSSVDSRASWAPGANYTGFIDHAETGGKLADKPIRREDVLIPLMKALDTRVYEGRVKGKNRLGTFMPKLEAVRVKRKGDLEVAAHEIAHMLDDRIPEIRKSWTQGPMSRTYANELRGVSYDHMKVYEGFAEFVRLHMTQPEKAKAAAPQFSKWFDDFTAQHEYGPAIQKAQADMGAWFGQDALHRAQSKIGARKEINKALDGIGDRFRQSVLDDLHGVMRMEREITGKTSPVGAYETARLTRGAYAITDGAIRLGHPMRKVDGGFIYEGKGLEKILEPVTERLDEFLMYAVGKSAQELMGQGREHLFTPAEVKSMVALERPEFHKAFADYQNWNKGVMDFAQEMGVVNVQSRAMWQRTQYLPFYRVGQAGANKSAGGVTGNWHGVHKLTGGSGNLRDILGNMTQNASMLILAALRNEARAKIAELAERPGGGRFMVKIAGDAKPVRIDREQVSKAVLEAMGLDKATIKGNPDAAKLAEHAKLIENQIMANPGMFEFFQHNQAPKGDVMAVLKNGMPTYYEVADPLLMRAITALERPAQHWLVNLLGIPKRIGQATITMTPDFMVANIARDTIMGAVMSRGGFIPVVDSLKGMKSRITKDPAYQEFIANGGGMSSYLLDETNMRAHLERFYTSKGINPKTVLDAPDKVMYAIETIADAFEMSTRLGEYKLLRERGAHPRHAAYAARDISTDFAMKGDSQVLGFMYDTVMFLRPAVVSMDRLYRGLAHDPNKGAIAAKSAAIAGMSAALYMLNRENPKYQDLEEWDKDNNWHFFVPRPDGSDIHFRYPKIWEIGALASIAERTMQHSLEGDSLGYGKDAARILGNVFHLNLMPQVIAPLAEQAANKNSFTNRPIETQGMEDMQPFMRAKPTTSETLKAAGMATRDLPESLQVNPVRAEALLRGYFNTWGMYGLMLSDQAFFGDKLPEKRLDEMPVLRRFYASDPAKHTKFESQFYDMLGEAKRLHNTMTALDKMNRPDIATEIEQRPMSGMYKQLERTSKELRGINGDMLETRRSDLTPEEKRQRLDALTVEKNALLKATVLDVNEQQKEIAR